MTTTEETPRLTYEDLLESEWEPADATPPPRNRAKSHLEDLELMEPAFVEAVTQERRRAEAMLSESLSFLPKFKCPIEMLLLSGMVIEGKVRPGDAIGVAYLIGRCNGDPALLTEMA